MKRFLKLCSIAAIVAAFTVSILGTGQASAVVNGSKAVQQQGAISLWNYDRLGVFRHRCTASLIDQYWAVTAAHCAYPSGPNPPVLIEGQTSVRAGSLNNTTGYQELGLEQVIVNPDYQSAPNGEQPLNDIALIKFKQPFKQPSGQPDQILKLPNMSPAVGTQGKVAGWGWDCDDNVTVANCGLPFTTQLLQTNLQIVDDSRCEWFSDPNGQLCTIGADGKHTMACRGDSGGPLVTKALDKFVLRGMVLGDGDYEINHPNECDSHISGRPGAGLFLDIAAYRPWIIDTMTGTSTASSNATALPPVNTRFLN